MARKLIGTGVTDENGEATITYTGTGAGKLNIVAESGTFVSETYNVLDTLMYDGGVTGNKNDTDWNIQVGTLETPIPVDTTGTKLKNNGSITAYYVANKHGTSPSGFDQEFELPFALEFDVVDSDDLSNCRIQCSPQTGTAFSPTLNQNQGQIGSHHRILFEEGKNTIYVDDKAPVVLERSFSGLCSIRFAISAGAYLKYKNFKVYPI